MQRRWYRQRREWPIENITVASVSEQSGFKDSLREFFGKERHALRPRQDLLEYFRGQRLSAGHPLDQRPGLRLRQPVQSE